MSIDLHIHSNYSDGSLPPERVVDSAMEVGLTAIAITDHDNILSHGIASKYLKEIGKESELELIPGIEVNTIWKGYEVHVLGYYMDLDSKPLDDLIKHQQNARVVQTRAILENLRKEGINIHMEDIEKLTAPEGSIGRPHLAKALTSKGGVNSMVEAYSTYINDESSTYVQRKTVSPHEAVEVIYEAKGVPVVAHPYDIDVAEDLIKELMNYGLRGIEAYHRKHSPAMIEYYSSLAEELGLIVTGGSDCHGPRPNGHLFMGKNFIPDWILEKLKLEKKHIEIASC